MFGAAHTISPNPIRSVPTSLLSLAYQPIVSLADGSVEAVEALTRVRLPLVGEISPQRFVRWMESSRLSTLHTNWVVEKACRSLAGRRFPKRPLRVSVNVSARDLGAPRFISTISESLRESRLDPSNLQLEITETSIVQTDPAMKARLADLRDLGVRIAIDDFGTGFSSLQSVLEIPADVVKLDRCFVRGLATSSKCCTVIRSAIGLAHSLGMEVVAEGVETKKQRAFLSTAGCDSIQGYLISRPMPLEKLNAVMGSCSQTQTSDGGRACRYRRIARLQPRGLMPRAGISASLQAT